MDKRLKDPIYGYIDIPENFIKQIIDTSVFQRLRRVLQTSYAPLYSSAIHNRFVHSIGVFYLGRIVAEQLKNELRIKQLLSEEECEQYAYIYEVACLLHDVGHAPFSHTGENFYKNEEYKSTQLHEMLANEVGTDSFVKDIPVLESEAAAPHELMSCIVGLREFGELLGDQSSREFFSRCITGYRYKDKNKENDIRNCFIMMLNSKVIDVDRLDYLIRDAYITGFETVNLDYVRLLRALTIVYDKEEYKVAYKKDALSIIENVVYAHDAEKKWIQNHPVVLYECYIIQHIISRLNEQLNDGENKLFSPKALSREGITLKEQVHVSLLCDDDVVYLFKNKFSDEISEEFFSREKRRHPVWKSEAEYNAYLNALVSDGQLKETFQDCLKSFIGGNQKDVQRPLVINRELVEELRKEVEKRQKDAEKALAETKDRISKQSIKQQLLGEKNRLSLCEYLVNYATEHDLPDDFVIIKANMFNSTFSKDEVTKVLIVFEQGEEQVIKPIAEVCKTLQAEGTKEEFYYLYYRRSDDNFIREKLDFCENLYFAANSR